MSKFAILLLSVFIANSSLKIMPKNGLLQMTLHAFDDTKVSFRAGIERLKRLPVSLALTGCQCGFIVVEFDDKRPQRQSGFVGLHLTHRPGQESSAE